MNDYCQCEDKLPYGDESQQGWPLWACEECGKEVDPEYMQPDWDAIGDEQRERNCD